MLVEPGSSEPCVRRRAGRCLREILSETAITLISFVLILRFTENFCFKLCRRGIYRMTLNFATDRIREAGKLPFRLMSRSVSCFPGSAQRAEGEAKGRNQNGSRRASRG